MTTEKKEVKYIDLNAINEIKDNNSAPDAKIKLQAYAKEFGFKLSKSNISLDGMITKLLEMADEQENKKIDAVPSVKTPEPKLDVNITEFGIQTEHKPESQDIGVAEKNEDCPDVGCPINLLDEVVEEVKENLLSNQQVTSIEITKKDGEIISMVSPVEPVEHIKIETKISDDFKPHFSLIGPVGNQYINVPYWVLDWIQEKGFSQWKDKIEEARKTDHNMLNTLKYYIQINGSVTVRESRNSQYHHLY